MLILLKIPLGRKRKLYLWKLEKFYSRAEKLSSEIFIKRSRLDEECCMLKFQFGRTWTCTRNLQLSHDLCLEFFHLT